jgi:hypothetical protein
MSVLDFGLGLAGLSEASVKELDKQLPALERLAAAAKQAEPILTQLMPILNKAYPDIVAVTPLIQQLIAFAKQKESEG